VLMGTFGGANESARSAKCLSNMRSLATACQSYGMATGIYPLAASMEYSELDESRGIRNVQEIFKERTGWISWASEGKYSGKPTSSMVNSGWFKSAYDSDKNAALHCLTNGAIWKYASENAALYVCPAHAKAANTAKKTAPRWSYAMNGYFGGDVGMTCKTMDESSGLVGYGRLNRADRRLLFAELPFVGGFDESLKASDPTLQYKGLSGAGGTLDKLNFNHTMGKKRCAHIVFADGHIDRLIMPSDGGNEEELLAWLCQGKDISFNGSRYEELTD